MKITQFKKSSFAVAIVLLISAFCHADLVIEFSDDGTDTTAVLTGSVDISTLSAPTSVNQPTSFVWATNGAIGFAGFVDRWEGVAFVPTSPFGTSGFVGGGTSGVNTIGDEFQFNATSGRLELPEGYVSGTKLNSTLTIPGNTVTDLGIVATQYSFLGGQTIKIQPVSSSIPEPSNLVWLSALTGLCYLQRRRPETR